MIKNPEPNFTYTNQNLYHSNILNKYCKFTDSYIFRNRTNNFMKNVESANYLLLNLSESFIKWI